MLERDSADTYVKLKHGLHLLYNFTRKFIAALNFTDVTLACDDEHKKGYSVNCFNWML